MYHLRIVLHFRQVVRATSLNASQSVVGTTSLAPDTSLNTKLVVAPNAALASPPIRSAILLAILLRSTLVLLILFVVSLEAETQWAWESRGRRSLSRIVDSRVRRSSSGSRPNRRSRLPLSWRRAPRRASTRPAVLLELRRALARRTARLPATLLSLRSNRSRIKALLLKRQRARALSNPRGSLPHNAVLIHVAPFPVLAVERGTLACDEFAARFFCHTHACGSGCAGGDGWRERAHRGWVGGVGGLTGGGGGGAAAREGGDFCEDA